MQWCANHANLYLIKNRTTNLLKLKKKVIWIINYIWDYIHGFDKYHYLNHCLNINYSEIGASNIFLKIGTEQQTPGERFHN